MGGNSKEKLIPYQCGGEYGCGDDNATTTVVIIPVSFGDCDCDRICSGDFNGHRVALDYGILARGGQLGIRGDGGRELF